MKRVGLLRDSGHFIQSPYEVASHLLSSVSDLLVFEVTQDASRSGVVAHFQKGQLRNLSGEAFGPFENRSQACTSGVHNRRSSAEGS